VSTPAPFRVPPAPIRATVPVRVLPEVRNKLKEAALDLRQQPGYGRLTPGDVMELLSVLLTDLKRDLERERDRQVTYSEVLEWLRSQVTP
jgi:hypothetical protein